MTAAWSGWARYWQPSRAKPAAKSVDRTVDVVTANRCHCKPKASAAPIAPLVIFLKLHRELVMIRVYAPCGDC